MADLNTNVRYIKGIGETRAKALEKLGVHTLRDLIGFFPRRYEDRSVIYPIAELPVGETACCRAMIAAIPTSRRIPGGRTVVKVRAVDETGTLDVTFFNQAYRQSLRPGDSFVFCGKVFAHLPGLPPVTLPLFLLRGLLGALAVIAAQLVLAMVIRSFAVPIFLGLLGGITGIFISSKGFGILWPYSLMQLGMNSNKSADALAGSYGLFAASCLGWLVVFFLLAHLLLRRCDVRA